VTINVGPLSGFTTIRATKGLIRPRQMVTNNRTNLGLRCHFATAWPFDEAASPLTLAIASWIAE
jgi:hypothetical protein